MQNPDDLALLKANDKTFTKLMLSFEFDMIADVDWYDLRTAIEGNTTVKEVHVKISKEFVEAFPLNQLLEICQAIGSLSSLKYLFLGQASGAVEVFNYMPVQAISTMLKHAGDKLLWWYLRGLVVTHIYKGSDEETEDTSGVLATNTKDREKRKSGKEKKKKDKKKKKEKENKEKKKSSKKEKRNSISGMDESSRRWDVDANGNKLDTKQAAAKRALEKLGDALLGLKNLKRVSLMGHFDDVMYGCQLDPLLEGLGALEELESFLLAVTRHEGRILVDPNALGTFLDGASPKLKDVTLLYIELTDDHVDEVASAIAKRTTLEELTLSGTGASSAESVGALFRSPYLKKLSIPELTLDDQGVVAMAIALTHCFNLKEIVIQCNLQAMELMAIQQMLIANAGLETMHLHLTGLESVSGPLDMITSLFANAKSKLTKVVFEGQDKNEDCKNLREIDVKDWEEVIEGFFKVETSHTIETHSLLLTRV